MAKDELKFPDGTKVPEGYFVSEWGELRPVAVEIDNTVPTPQSESKVKVNKVVIPEVAEQGEK